MKTPCIKECRLDSSREYCTSCKRTTSEIANWSSYNVDQQQSIMETLKDRKTHDDNIRY